MLISTHAFAHCWFYKVWKLRFSRHSFLISIQCCLSELKSSWQLRWWFSSRSPWLWLLVLTSGPPASANATHSQTVSAFSLKSLRIVGHLIVFLFVWCLIFLILLDRLLCVLVRPMFRLHHSPRSRRVSLLASAGQLRTHPTHHYGNESVCPTHVWHRGNDFTGIHCKKINK